MINYKKLGIDFPSFFYVENVDNYVVKILIRRKFVKYNEKKIKK